MEKKIKIEIKNRFTGEILFEFEKEDNIIRDTLQEAKEQGDLGEKIGDTWDAQVFLVFDHPLSLSYVRDALDSVEEGMKYGKLKGERRNDH